MDSKKNGASRRDFLKLAGASAPAAVAAATVAAPTDAQADAALEGSGLRKTEHVEKYLASARF